jgi:peptide/nickel transport system substrate-binding protein
MKITKRNAISTTLTVAIIVVILVIAAVAAYLALAPAPSTTTTSTTSPPTTSTTSPPTTSTTSPPTTSTTSPPTTTTSVPSSYGPTNSSVLVDESSAGGPTAAYDSLDPQYAFYLQDVALLNAVYQNLVELNGSSGTGISPVLAQSYEITNGGNTTIFHIRPDVWFSNGDNFTAYAVWFTIVRNLFMNAPSGIAPFNWNAILYDTSGYEYSAPPDGCSLGVPWGLRAAIQHATGLQTAANTMAACNIAVSVLNNMLSKFNPANSTQAAIMAYPNQAVVVPDSMTFTVNYLNPVGTFGLQLWSGFDGQNVVDPAFIDANGGVTNNTLNDYINTHGAIGTGPYVIQSVGASYSPVVFVATPHYWATKYFTNGVSSVLPAVAQPAKIKEVIYNVPATDTALIEDFATNKAQLSSEPSVSEWGQFYSAFHAKEPSFKFQQILDESAGYPFGSWFLMNQHLAPTNITDFRKGWLYALNYTAINFPNTFNGTSYYAYYIPVLTPAFGSDYNPNNYSIPQQDTTKAFNCFSEAGIQGHWYTVVPSTFTLSNGTSVAAGTIVGDPNGQQLAPVKIYYAVPLLSELRGQLQIVQQNLGLFGITVVPYGITAAESNILTSSPDTFPTVEILGWGPDYEDPFLAMYEPLLAPSPYNGWFDNATVEAELNACLFPTSATEHSCGSTLSKMVVDNVVFPQWPDQAYYYFYVQPYVKGMMNNPFIGYWYNLLYYQPAPT